MKQTLTAALTAALSMSLAGAAVAQPAPPPPAAPPSYAAPPPAAPPQPAPAPPVDRTEAQYPQNDVSTIDGVPVPIGEHNEYHYTFKRWNISTNPIGWMLGLYGASLSYGVGQNVAIRADLNYFDPTGGDGYGTEVGIGLPIYFRRTYQGLFLEPGFISRTVKYGGDDTTDTTAGPQMLVGWQWMWDSGLNFAVAAGIGRNWSTKSGDYEYNDDGVFANGYMRFGYAF